VEKLGDAVDLFKCCIFTLNAFTIVLPAFLVAGALVVFVPSYSVMKYLGARASRIISYGVAAVSGNVLTVCSCNVVPIFAGILRRGAGIGPAFCFVFAAPAIHIVNTAFTYQVIGPRLALWRFFTVPIIAVVLGAIMATIFRKEEKDRQCEVQGGGAVSLVAATAEQARRGELFLGLLIGVLIFGAWMPLDGNLPGKLGQYVRLAGVLIAAGVLTRLAVKWFGREESREWGRQTWLLLRMILPIFAVSVIVIAFIIQRIELKWIMPTAADTGGIRFGHPEGNSLPAVFIASVFSTLMYFPMLTEVAFAKGLLLRHFALGPALALLLGGPGLSLPGLLLVSKVAGWKKMIVYWLLMVTLITLVAFAFGTHYGEYECSCQLKGPGSEMLVDSPPAVGWVGLGWYAVLMAWIALMLAKAGRGRGPDDAVEDSA
jgi:uncharacterized membrane protein YraQ (UPF0718 family)